ncbi:vanadium-dependent haloperoxidase [Alteribacillus bidgolensis]|uniref:PAP2 superfamily protein n=1 Tax=Alteribacillus bidgolensis TaxID=930129 RepID=A0A1G8FT68_9BACI|nr:vanadium-dependent haloperoxidase [Alteribacillus bidgolensis]SDH85301.1 PAP2 superfamily protein [Alteribacillus bidgolensis]
MRTIYRRWSEYPYPGEQTPPKAHPEPAYFPMFFVSRRENNEFLDPFRLRIIWQIKNPIKVDWETELSIVEQTILSLTPQKIQIAQFWGNAEATQNMIPMIFSLARKYRLGSPNIARIFGYFHAGVNDAFVMSWYFKYLWDVARPNQYGRNLSPILLTPLFPSYPSAHATVAGCAEAILTYFFPLEAAGIRRTMEECALSRLYAGVHFKVDNDEGLRLGRQIGGIVVRLLKAQNPNNIR